MRRLRCLPAGDQASFRSLKSQCMVAKGGLVGLHEPSLIEVFRQADYTPQKRKRGCTEGKNPSWQEKVQKIAFGRSDSGPIE
jgi:hypothetical protein